MLPKLELVAASAEAVELAVKHQLDRVELCQDLDQGGLTPSAGFISFAVAQKIETHVLIRPRAAGFHYSESEMRIMEKDIELAGKMGVKGVVIGTLQANFDLDKVGLSRLAKAAKGLDVTCHRAFDESIDWQKSIDTLIQLGFKRILTSGFAANVNLGLNNIKQMRAYAGNQIEIMPGGGVNASNIQKILEVVEPTSIHFSGAVKTLIDEESAFSETMLKVEEKRIQRLVELVKGYYQKN